MFQVFRRWVRKDNNVVGVEKGELPLYYRKYNVNNALEPARGNIKSELHTDGVEQSIVRRECGFIAIFFVDFY